LIRPTGDYISPQFAPSARSSASLPWLLPLKIRKKMLQMFHTDTYYWTAEIGLTHNWIILILCFSSDIHIFVVLVLFLIVRIVAFLNAILIYFGGINVNGNQKANLKLFDFHQTFLLLLFSFLELIEIIPCLLCLVWELPFLPLASYIYLAFLFQPA